LVYALEFLPFAALLAWTLLGRSGKLPA
jgi:hypothetical protein